MNYMGYLTILESEEKSVEHQRHLYEIEELVRMMIEELVPQVVEKNLVEALVKITTTINGEKVDFKDVKEYIINRLIEELSK